MTPKALAAMIAAAVGGACASLFGLGLIGRSGPQQFETVKPVLEAAKRTVIIIDDEWAPLAMSGPRVFPGMDVDVARAIPLANGDTHWEIVLDRVRVREIGGDDPRAVRYTFQVTPEQAAHFAEAKKRGKFRAFICPTEGP